MCCVYVLRFLRRTRIDRPCSGLIASYLDNLKSTSGGSRGTYITSTRCRESLMTWGTLGQRLPCGTIAKQITSFTASHKVCCGLRVCVSERRKLLGGWNRKKFHRSNLTKWKRKLTRLKSRYQGSGWLKTIVALQLNSLEQWLFTRGFPSSRGILVDPKDILHIVIFYTQNSSESSTFLHEKS
jgi:hypothetical protein